jgi:5-methylcytosine-specific restriction protein B
MILNEDRTKLSILIPNSEATISAQIKNIKDSEVTGYYTNDKEEIKNNIVVFLNKNFEYILDVQSTLKLIDDLKTFKDEYAEIYKDGFSNIDISYDYFKNLNNNFVRIPKMYYSGVDNRYYKFENSDPVIKKLRSILYGDITGFNINIYNNQYYVISPYLKENALEILKSKKEKILGEIQYWTYSPGENAVYWDYCFNNKKMIIGWDELGDLSKYSNRDEIAAKVKEKYNKEDARNDISALDDFTNNIKQGDIIIAKVGQSKLLGYGKVIDNSYTYNEKRSEFKNERNVEWIKRGEWDVPSDLHFAQKTLTNITSYTDFAQKLINIMEGFDASMEEKFKQWLLENGLMETTVNGYINAINLTSREAMEDGIITKELFNIENVLELDKIIDVLSTNEKFLKRKENTHNHNSAPLNRYRDFLSMISTKLEAIEEYDKNKFLEEVFITEDKYDSIVSILSKKKNIILEGAPGVGKTFMAKRLAYSIIGAKDKSKVELIQFHQSYSYEEFIEGYRPVENGFELQRGIFYKLCKKAENDKSNNYYLVIDEINRGNLSKIFGELLMLIEADKRGDSLKLAYSEEEFSVPENLYIIGLMNTADRSLALIDYALRRRFSFIKIEPAFESEKFRKAFNNKFDKDYENVINIIIKINEAIKNDKSLGDGFKIGHSYFCPDIKDRKGNKKDIQDIINYEIIPLLEEYWYDDEDSLVQWENALNGVINDD